MIGGPAGSGIINAGMSFVKCLSRGGLNIFSTNEYPSLIRGGHNSLFVRASDKPINSHVKEIIILVALNQEAVELHKEEMAKDGAIIYDGNTFKLNQNDFNCKLINVPLLKIAKENGKDIMRNTVALGASVALMDYELDMLNNSLASIFAKKDSAIIEMNKQAAKVGYEFVKKNFGSIRKITKVKGAPKRIVLNCNDAISLGALKAGLKIFAAYPMTPASSILHTLAKYERDMQIIVKHTEDELASMNMIIGAGFAGVRAMTSTSGGGFALMNEAFGLAGMAEVPCVIVEAQRGGPSTGLPTRQEQADLKFVINSSQGEFPRLVMAPGDIKEAFYETINVFNLAEKYQVPAVILTDKYNYASSKSIDVYDMGDIKIERGKLLTEKDAKNIKDYKRYKFAAEGVSPRAIPGLPNTIFRSTGNEHDEYGDISEDAVNRKNMVDKRMKKMNGLLKDIKEPIKIHGPKNAELTVIGWGSTKGPIIDAIALIDKKVNFLQVLYPWPFPTEKIKSILKNSKALLLIEGNATGQLGSLIMEHTGIEIKNKFLKYDGRQFLPSEISKKISEVLK